MGEESWGDRISAMEVDQETELRGVAHGWGYARGANENFRFCAGGRKGVFAVGDYCGALEK